MAMGLSIPLTVVLAATPLPRVPEIPLPEGTEGRHLQGVMFIKLTHELRAGPKEDGDTDMGQPAAEGVAAALISQERELLSDGHAE